MTSQAFPRPSGLAPRTPRPSKSRRGAEKADDPFPYGFRWREVRDSHGSKRYEQVALVPEDFLNPQVDDVMPPGNWHDQFLGPLVGLLRFRLRPLGMYVFHDLIIRFNLPGVSNPAPDISVVRHDQVIDPKIESWDAEAPERRPFFVAEALSPRTKDMDLKDKKRSYARAGVREYFIFNILKEPVEILGFRLDKTKRSYRGVRADASGRIVAKTLGIAFRVDATQPLGAVVEDEGTGEHLLTLEETVEALEQEKDAFELKLKAEAAARARAEKRAEELAARLEEVLDERRP